MIRTLGFGLVGLAMAGTAAAHHGFGTFDMSREMEVSGVITGVDFINPHSWLYLDETDADGQVSAWRCELRAATVLRRSGWSPDMFVPGEYVRITGSPDRNDPNSCYLSTIFFEDGSSMNRYGQLERPIPTEVRPEERPLRLASGEPNISGDWAPEQFVMTDPRGQRGPLVPLSIALEVEEPGSVPEGWQGRGPSPAAGVELTEAGEAFMEVFPIRGPDSPRMRCETTSIIFDWTFDGPVNRITQHDDHIRVQYGQLGFERIIHMNMREHPENIVPSRGGHSVGRWEDDVLVVETIGFEPGLLGGSIVHSDQLRVVERFELDPETLALTRSYVAEDPLYFTGQYAGSDTILPADLPFSPDPCTELSFVDYSQEGRPATASEQAEEPEARPWWRFWQ
jgi:hypothetical protein